jgi:tetratricopeptide (TPR) repeat protein/predicted Ser/Thr protein kinase
VDTPRDGARPTDDDRIGGVKTQGDGDDTIAADEHATTAPSVVGRGSTLGRYVVLDRLGAGGMGVVFTAYDPELDRRVAIKLLQARSARSAKATGGRARLLREAQAMAKLSHPNVIAVYDVGTIGDDVFLAMEFIAGRTLKAWLAEKAGTLDWRETLRVFVEAGRGLAAAHAAGIVHRDFKPENVMIDQQERARVLDFGLARPARDSQAATDDVVPPSSVVELRLTATGAVMGTPFYMAPEQHRGEMVDERADQFSFCVALWEALYGARPFPGTTLPELARSVLAGDRVEPPRAAGVPPTVRRALDRGLSIDPDARFASMNDLLGELLRDVGARRRLLAIGAGVVALPAIAVVAALTVSHDDPPCRDFDAGVQDVWNEATRERVREAFAQFPGSEAAFTSVAQEIDAYAESWTAARTEACEATRVRNEQSEQVLEQRYACLDARTYRVEALVDTFTDPVREVVFQSLSLVQQLPAIADCSDIARMRSLSARPNDPAAAAEVDEVRRRLAHLQTLGNAGGFEDADQRLRELVVEAEATGFRPIHGDVLDTYGRISMFFGDVAEAERALEEAQLIGEAEGYDELIFQTHLSMALLYSARRNEFDRADRHLARAAAVLERVGRPPRAVSDLAVTEARVHMFAQRDEEAIAAYERYLAAAREQGRDDTFAAISALGYYGNLLCKVSRVDEAEVAIDRALERIRALVGDTHPEVAGLLIFRSRVLKARGEAVESLAVLDEALAVYEHAFGPTHSNVGAALNDQAIVLSSLGRYEEALAKVDQAAPIVAAAYGEENVQSAALMINKGEALLELGRPAEALVAIQRAAEVRLRRLGRDHIDHAYALVTLGETLLELGRVEEAREAFEDNVRVSTSVLGEQSSDSAQGLVGLGDVAMVQERTKEARASYERAIEVLERAADSPAMLARARFGLARVTFAEGDREAALALARDARALLVDQPAAGRHLARIDAWIAAPR